MSNRVSGRSCRSVLAFAALAAVSISLAGCSSLGSSFSDPVTTGSTSGTYAGNRTQAMPQQLSDISPSVDTASARYLPPANVGAGASRDPLVTATVAPQQQPKVVAQDLPSLNASSPVGSTQTMPQQVPFQTASTTPPAVKAAPSFNATATGGYTHIIESGESLYAIARKYKVSTESIVQANQLGSPDKIFVGQKLTIPGVTGVPKQPVAANDTVKTAGLTPTPAEKKPEPKSESTPEPIKVAATPSAKAEADLPPAAPRMPAPAASNSKFRWPVSGKIVADFAASKGTGINIDVPEGTAVRASETGTVIYVGSAVEGYGNLILVKHDNGFVSAYAHLSQITVSKGATVQRGDAIGLTGMTGNVSRPQLHFELRKGATPVDPVPLLAS